MSKAKRSPIIALALAALAAPAQTISPLRPPAVPLIAHDPYFSVWSPYDRLTDGPTRHWTGSPESMLGLIRIDGKPFRFLGGPYRDAPAMNQVGMELLPTRTIYQFIADEVQVTLTFMTPAFPEDLDVLSRPVTYLNWDVRSTDSRTHRVSLYFDCAAQFAVNAPDQQVIGSRARIGDLEVLRIGSSDQPVLGKSGDNLRIDWGFLYVAAPQKESAARLSQPTASRAAILCGTVRSPHPTTWKCRERQMTVRRCWHLHSIWVKSDRKRFHAT